MKASDFPVELKLAQGRELALEQTLHIPREQVLSNIKHNVQLVLSEGNLVIERFASLIGREEAVVRNFIQGKHGAPTTDTHLIYSFAKYAGVDLNTFVSSKLETLPFVASRETGLMTSLQMRENYVQHLSSLANQMGINGDEQFYEKFKSYPRINSSFSIFSMHNAANIVGHDLDTLLNTPTTENLTPNPNRHRTIQLIEAPTRIVVENARLARAKETIVKLVNNQRENLEKLSHETGIELNKIINFYRGRYTPNLDFMKKISDFYNYNVDDFLNLSFDELSHHHVQITSSQTSSSLPMNLQSDNPTEKFKRNLTHILDQRQLTLEQIGQRIGRKIPENINLANVTMVQDIANTLGYSLHTLTSCEPAQLPTPNTSLIKKITQKTAKMILLGGSGLLLTILPAMALDASIESAANEFNNHVDDLYDSNLPADHQVNLTWKFLVLSGQCATDWYKLIGTTLDGVTQGLLKRSLDNLTPDVTFTEQLLAPLYLPSDVAQGALEGYLKSARPIVAHTIEWLKTWQALNAPDRKSLSYANALLRVSNGHTHQPSPAREYLDYFLQTLNELASNLMNSSNSEKEEMKSSLLNELVEYQQVFGRSTFKLASTLSLNESLERAEAFLKEKKYNEALSVIRPITESNPDSAVAHKLCADSYYELGQTEISLTYYNRAIELNPGMAQFYLYRYFAHRKHGDHESALKDAEKYTEMRPDNDNIAWLQRVKEERNVTLTSSTTSTTVQAKTLTPAQEGLKRAEAFFREKKI